MKRLISVIVIYCCILASTSLVYAGSIYTSEDDAKNYTGWSWSQSLSAQPTHNSYSANSWYTAMLNQLWGVYVKSTQTYNVIYDTFYRNSSNIAKDVIVYFKDTFPGMMRNIEDIESSLYNANTNLGTIIGWLTTIDNHVQTLDSINNNMVSYLNNLGYGTGYTTDTLNKDLDDIKSAVTGIRTDLGYQNHSLYSDVSNISSKASTSDSKLSSIYSYLGDVRTYTANTSSNSSSIAGSVSSIAEDSSDISSGITVILSKLNEISQKIIPSAQEEDLLTIAAVIQTEYISPSGKASASGSDYLTVSSGVSALKNSVSGSGSPSNAFSILLGNDGWGWFSSEVASDLDQTEQLRKAGSSTSVYDDKVNEILAGINGDKK